jgi:hypothetical protein
MTTATRMAMAGAAAAGVVVLVVVLPGSGQGGDEHRRTSSPSPWRPPPDCPVTVPNGSSPPGEASSPEIHGNGRLWAALGRRGIFLVAPETAPEYYDPDGGLAVDGALLPDGSVGIKAPWWRGPGVRGRVRLQARRLDAAAPRVDYTVSPSGYGLTGFQAMGLSLPTTGCWRVTGSVGEARLTYVTLVWRVRGSANSDAERGRLAGAPTVSCRDGGRGAAPLKGRDVSMGPLTILFARRTVRDARDAFNGHGWKLPVTLLADATATLSVPPRLQERVGLVFTRETQSRVWRRGVRAADSRVSFEACAGENAPARTGWPGGIVVDRRQCARLRVQVEGATEPIERRVPLGRRCR